MEASAITSPFDTSITAQAALSLAQALRHEMLHLAVDGEIDVRARRARIAAQLADDAAIGVHFDAVGAGGAADLRVEFLFDAALADAEARKIEQRIVVVASCLPAKPRRHSPARATCSSPKG